MKTTIWLLVFLFFIVHSSKPNITFNPFSVQFGSPYTPFALFFLVIYLTLIQLQSRKDGKLEAFEKYYRMGFKEGSEFTVEQINEELKKQKPKH